jgi:hypothetical protein
MGIASIQARLTWQISDMLKRVAVVLHDDPGCGPVQFAKSFVF